MHLTPLPPNSTNAAPSTPNPPPPPPQHLSLPNHSPILIPAKPLPLLAHQTSSTSQITKPPPRPPAPTRSPPLLPNPKNSKTPKLRNSKTEAHAERMTSRNAALEGRHFGARSGMRSDRSQEMDRPARVEWHETLGEGSSKHECECALPSPEQRAS
ncbi:hypothetical protein M758_3G090800 [Ceratodon purpureus]|nr:hypothetical protein M758_3G090800 [Ceratodon purpureus]